MLSLTKKLAARILHKELAYYETRLAELIAQVDTQDDLIYGALERMKAYKDHARRLPTEKPAGLIRLLKTLP